MSEQSAEPIRLITGEEILEKARQRERRPEPTSDAQIAVARNIERNVGRYFLPDPGGADQFILNPDLHLDAKGQTRPIVDALYEIVSWEFVGIHAHSFRGISPTGKPVWFRGLTVTQPDDKSDSGYTYSQFIDWREVLLQLGIVPEASRPLLARADIERRDQVRETEHQASQQG